MGRTKGHVRGYFLVTTLPSNHREIQYSQLRCAPTLIATGIKANIEYTPVDPEETKKHLFRSASDGEWVSNGLGGGHDPYGAVVCAQGGGWKRNALLRRVLYPPYQPWVWAVRTLLPTSHQWLSLGAERADHLKPPPSIAAKLQAWLLPRMTVDSIRLTTSLPILIITDGATLSATSSFSLNRLNKGEAPLDCPLVRRSHHWY